MSWDGLGFNFKRLALFGGGFQFDHRNQSPDDIGAAGDGFEADGLQFADGPVEVRLDFRPLFGGGDHDIFGQVGT